MSDRVLQFRQKVSENPNNFLYKYSLAQVLFEKGKFEEAVTLFEQCLAAKPDWMMSALFLAKTYLALENKPLAIKHLELTKKLASEQKHDDPFHEANDLLVEIG
jgi:predicted Zn-dependent protease